MTNTTPNRYRHRSPQYAPLCITMRAAAHHLRRLTGGTVTSTGWAGTTVYADGTYWSIMITDPNPPHWRAHTGDHSATITRDGHHPAGGGTPIAHVDDLRDLENLTPADLTKD